mmetsp:Transcript_14189/g.44288  ORF Transcript_14189/g.44288 Transcript_14189/m.44288 type:complete len:252 (-) Transcript_14189:1138-1893(-)
MLCCAARKHLHGLREEDRQHLRCCHQGRSRRRVGLVAGVGRRPTKQRRLHIRPPVPPEPHGGVVAVVGGYGDRGERGGERPEEGLGRAPRRVSLRPGSLGLGLRGLAQGGDDLLREALAEQRRIAPHGVSHRQEHEALGLHRVLMQSGCRPSFEGQGSQSLTDGDMDFPGRRQVTAQPLDRFSIGQLHQLDKLWIARGRGRPLECPLEQPLAVLGRTSSCQAARSRPEQRTPLLWRRVQRRAELQHRGGGR